MLAARAIGVCKEYPAGPHALAEVDLELSRGAVTVLLGANGAGKTTLLRILAGLLSPTSGTVEVLGLEPPAPELRRRTGYVPQEVALDPEMTGGETLALLAALYGVSRRDRPARIEQLAESFGITSHLERRVASWSGGLKRRLHLAAGMIHDPELLLLDEPTAGLDVDGSASLWEELERRAAAGSAVAVITHDLAAAERHAGQVVILDAGRIVAAGTLAELKAQGQAASLAEVYRHRTGRDPAALLPRRPGGKK